MEDVHFRVSGLVFTTLGFWPINFKSKIAAFLYKTYYYVAWCAALSFLSLQLLEMPNTIQKGLLNCISQLAVATNFCIGMIKYLILHRTKAKTLIKKIQATEQYIINQDEEEVKYIFMKYANHSNKLSLVLTVLFVVADSIFIAAPLLVEARLRNLGLDLSDVVVDGYKERPFVLEFYVPFNKFKYYTSTYIWSVVTGIFNSLIVVASDNVYFGLIIFPIGQLALLRRDMEVAINVSKQNEIGRNLKKVILYHKGIIRYTQELNEVMEFLLLAVLLYVFQIALTCFQLVTQPLSFEIAKSICYLLIILSNLFLYYWLGNEVQLGSVQLIKTIMNSKWYECDDQTKKTLLFVMMRAKKPLRFSVGFFYMSTETMLIIYKNCASYTAAVRTMYARNSNSLD